MKKAIKVYVEICAKLFSVINVSLIGYSLRLFILLGLQIDFDNCRMDHRNVSKYVYLAMLCIILTLHLFLPKVFRLVGSTNAAAVFIRMSGLHCCTNYFRRRHEEMRAVNQL